MSHPTDREESKGAAGRNMTADRRQDHPLADQRVCKVEGNVVCLFTVLPHQHNLWISLNMLLRHRENTVRDTGGIPQHNQDHCLCDCEDIDHFRDNITHPQNIL